MSVVNAQFQDWKGNVYHFETSIDMIEGLDGDYYTKPEVDEMMDDLKEYVVDGKNKIANAINDKTNDSQMSKDNTFDELAEGIRNIQTGCPINGIIKKYKVKKGETIEAGDFVNFINGESEIFDKPTTEIVSDDCDVRAVQYSKNVILLAWHTIKDNTDYIYVCDLKINEESIIKGKDTLVYSIKRVNPVDSFFTTQSYIKNFFTFDKIGSTNRIFILYQVIEQIDSITGKDDGVHITEVIYKDNISFKTTIQTGEVLLGTALTHITGYFNEEDTLFFVISKYIDELEEFIVATYFKILSDGTLRIMGSLNLSSQLKSSYNYKFQYIDVKMHGKRKFATLWKKIGTDDYVYYLHTIAVTTDGTIARFNGYSQKFTLPKTQYIYFGTHIINFESVVIYGDLALQAKIFRFNNDNKIEIEDCKSEINHTKICNVFDMGTYIDIDRNQYCNANVGKYIICFNDDRGKYFAELGIDNDRNLIELHTSKCITGNLDAQITKLEYPVHMKETSNRVFFMSNNKLIVINLSDSYGKSIEVESIVNLIKMNLNIDGDSKGNKSKIFYINNRYIILNPNQKMDSFLLDSNSSTDVIDSSESGLEAYNATYEEIFAGVAKTSGTGGEYIEVYVSKCRE